MSAAVKGVKAARSQGEQEAVSGEVNQPVHGNVIQQDDAYYFDPCQQDFYCRQHPEIFMRCQRCGVRHVEQAYQECHQGNLIDPVDGIHSVRGKNHAAINRPQPHGFPQDEYHQGKNEEDAQGRGKNLVQPLVIVPSQFIGDEPADGRVQTAVEQSEKSHQAADDVVNPVIRYSQRVQGKARRVQPDDQIDQRTGVKQHGVAGNAFVAVFFSHGG